MKVRIEYIKEGENEIVLRCDEINNEVLEILSLLNMRIRKISGHKDGKVHLLEPAQVYYCESVDNNTFAYTKEDVFRLNSNLSELESSFRDVGFFRCSKSMIINLNAISCLKSEIGNRIDATLKNGEHIMISRHYVKLLKEVLQTSN